MASIKEARRVGLKLKLPSDNMIKAAANHALSDFKNLIDREWTCRTIRFIPYPSAGHEVIVARCLNGKRPFRPRSPQNHNRDDKEKGYRDFLLWLTICETYRACSSEIAFITHDYEAFWDKERRGLHPELFEDLDENASRRIRLFESIDAFLDAYYYPNLQRQEELEARVLSGFRGEINFGHEIAGYIFSLLCEFYEERCCEIRSFRIRKVQPKEVLLTEGDNCCIRGSCIAYFDVLPEELEDLKAVKPTSKCVQFGWTLDCDQELKKCIGPGLSYKESQLEL
jgi:hypothetical protein